MCVDQSAAGAGATSASAAATITPVRYLRLVIASSAFLRMPHDNAQPLTNDARQTLVEPLTVMVFCMP